MKVVLFCGGYGMRMRNGTADDLPKPMHAVGPRPLLWHVMRYYAHFGHTEFILCLGYGARHIKNFFLNYAETDSNDFVLRDGTVRLRSADISGWSIDFVHTGLASSIGERLRRVRHLVADDEVFLANYADVLTDAPLDGLVDRFHTEGATAAMLVVPPQSSFHCVELGERSMVSAITPVSSLPIWENGGYFVLRQDVFDHLPPGGDLVDDACAEFAKRGELLAYPYRGFWQPADTVKERAALENAYLLGERPWMLWESEHPSGPDAFAASDSFGQPAARAGIER